MSVTFHFRTSGGSSGYNCGSNIYNYQLYQTIIKLTRSHSKILSFVEITIYVSEIAQPLM